MTGAEVIAPALSRHVFLGNRSRCQGSEGRGLLKSGPWNQLLWRPKKYRRFWQWEKLARLLLDSAKQTMQVLGS